VEAAARVVGSLLAGAAVALAFPPDDLPEAAWLGAALALRCLIGAGWALAAALGALFGVTAALCLGRWLPGMLASTLEVDGSVALFLWIGACAPWAAIGAGYGLCLSRLAPRSRCFAPLAGVLWAIAEIVAAFVTGLPWFVLGAPFVDGPLAAAAASVGVHGVSAAIVALAGALAQAGAGMRMRAVAGGLAVVGAASLAAMLGAAQSAAQGRELRVALVQPATPRASSADSRFDHERLAALVRLTRALGAVELIVWPESVLRAPVEARPEPARSVGELAREIEVPILFGAERIAARGRHASVLLARPDGETLVVHDKRRLLPVAERAPVALPAALRRRLGALAPQVSRVEGEGARVAAPELAGAAVALCWEALFSERPADPHAPFLLQLADHAWVAGTPAAAHALVLARWRAIEAGAPLLRVDAVGPSAVVDRDGSVRQRLAAGEPGTLVARVAPGSVVTVFERLGYWTLLAAGAALLALECRERAVTLARSVS
jgi:apolipoprotein N-acyltransferase